MIWLDRLRGRLRLLSTARYTRARVEEEFAFHIEMEAQRMVHSWGLDPAIALRRAREAFGDRDALRAELVGVRPVWPLENAPARAMRSPLELPDLAMIGGLGTALVVALCPITFTFSYGLLHPLPAVDEGDRVIALESWNPALGIEDRRSKDFQRWRDGMESVSEMSAFRNVETEVIAGGGAPIFSNVAAMTASGFGIARVPPLLGRRLREIDERADAAPVVVIGYQVWAERFARDASVVGRTVRIGGTNRTIVGVMPEGFRFPVRYDYWIPLAAATLDTGWAETFVFGRLVPGATVAEAQREMERLETRSDRRSVAVPLHTFLTNLQDENVRAAWGVNNGRLLGHLALQVLAMSLISALLAFAGAAVWSRLSGLRVRSLHTIPAD